MKKKLVLWGTNAQDERVLIALKLHTDTNKVSIYSFPESSVTEEFSKKMMNDWRNDQEVDFPENHTVQERELTVSESILPEDLKVERGDVIQRAQTEWHFIVLSSKLYEAYESELNELKDKVEGLKGFDSAAWDSLKGFWSKVQGQVQERNLFREHANTLRENTNQLFGKLKEMRASLDEEFKTASQTHYQTFMKTLEEVEQKVTDGLNLRSVFEELKKMQKEFRDTKFTKEHRSKIWDRMDAAFKNVKEKQFGKQGGGGASGDNSPMERLKRRYSGLLGAIEKMERSIKRDRDDFKFQDRKIADSDGQLEQQIRQAKIKMIEERIRSKEEKLNEMLATKVDLERRIEKQKEKDEKQAAREKVKEAQAAAKAKIASKIKEEEASRSVESEKLEKAASAISGKKEAETTADDSMVEAISTTMGEALEDVVDTMKAVAEVVSGKVEKAVSDIKEEMAEAKEEIKKAKEEEE